MKQVNVSDECAKTIEALRKAKIGNYESEMEGILEALCGINDMICFSRESQETAQFADDAHKAADKLCDYFRLIKLLAYEADIKDFGRIVVEQSES